MPWSEVYFVGAFAVYVAIRAHFERLAGALSAIEAPHAGAERVLLIVMALGTVGAPALHLLTPWLTCFDYEVPAAVASVGVVVSLTALWLFWRAHADLGRNWSRTMAITAEQRLVTVGVYRHVRHPMYAAIWLFAFAQGCVLHNALAGWSALVAFSPMYLFRVSREEAMMHRQFGDAYAQYCRDTGRLWPRRRRAA